MEWKDIPNADLVALAVYLLGGERRKVALEDIAVTAGNLAPGRFSWQKYPDQIDINLVRECLPTATGQENGNLVSGSFEEGWVLTEKGVRLSREHENRLPNQARLSGRMTEEEMRFYPWQKRRIQAHPTYKKVVSGLSDTVSAEEAKKFFLLDRKSDISTRRQKIGFLMRSFEHDPVIGPVITVLARKAGRI